MKVVAKDSVGERIGHTQVDGLERGFAATIETSPELDLGNAARSKIANASAVIGGVFTTIRGSTRIVVAITGAVCVGPACVGPVSVGPVIGASRYEMTQVVENGIFSKIGGDTKDGIERVGLNSGLNRSSGGSDSYSMGTSIASGSVSLTSVHELVAHELGYNIDVLSRTVGV